nr:helix-turn-helix transcriptional regulator [Bifidobacterium sp. SO4]
MAVAGMRRERGLSQEALALAAGMDRSFMGRVERGEQSVSLDKIWAICDVLRVTPSILFTRAEAIAGPEDR